MASSVYVQIIRLPDSRPTSKLYLPDLLDFGKKLKAVVLATALSGSSLAKVPAFSLDGPCQTFTAICFSLEPVAKNRSSCDQETPQIIR